MVLADRYGTRLIFGFDEVFRKNGYRLPDLRKTHKQPNTRDFVCLLSAELLFTNAG